MRRDGGVVYRGGKLLGRAVCALGTATSYLTLTLGRSLVRGVLWSGRRWGGCLDRGWLLWSPRSGSSYSSRGDTLLLLRSLLVLVLSWRVLLLLQRRRLLLLWLWWLLLLRLLLLLLRCYRWLVRLSGDLSTGEKEGRGRTRGGRWAGAANEWALIVG